MSSGAARLAAATATWLVTSALLYMLFTGEWTAIDWVGAAACGAAVAAATVPMTRMGLFDLRVDPRWLTALPGTLVRVFADFAIVTVFLARSVARRERGHGSFVARGDFDSGGPDAAGTTWRAFVAVTSTVSPNSYVVDIDPDHRTRLSHDLVPDRRSEQPA
ncbi:MAG TPA: hypothetical protein VFN68_13815 [Acidimicrobiales bacterium]|nr:hypothetical protein [Acidimicrobiales bacterium]